MTVLGDPPITATGVLAGLRPGQRADLRTHLAVHGALPLPAGRDDAWAAGVVGALERAGLSGRGGAGFPTAAKLRWLRDQGRRPVLAVNVMEGEPASRKDHVPATSVPHLVLDGAAVVARSLDAVRVYVCVPAEAEAAAVSLRRALDERAAAEADPVLAELVRPPGHYVAGEESALSGWLDGAGSQPRFRPDRPAVNRVRGRPCLVHNAETLAQIGLLARAARVGEVLADGTGRALSTLVTVSGAVDYGGVYEITLGTPLASVLGMAGATERPAGVLLGGYGGAWLSPEHLDVAYDAPSLRRVGASPGAGVVVVLPEGSCGLAETARIAMWMAGESAGQCGPCVFGLPALAEDLWLLATGSAQARDLDLLRSRLDEVDGRGACRHPDGVVRLVRSALGVFDYDLRRHLAQGPCAGTRARTVLAFPRQSVPA